MVRILVSVGTGSLVREQPGYRIALLTLLASVSGLPILHTCGHPKLHTWRFDLADGRVGM